MEQTFIKLYEKSLQTNFDLLALSDYGSDISFTYGEVAQEIEKLHLLFSDCKIKKGEKIAIIGKNTSRWCIAYLGIVTYGAIVVPILQDFNPNDISHIINHSETTILFSTNSIWETLHENNIPNLRGAYSLSNFNILYQKEGHKLPSSILEVEDKYIKKYPAKFTANDIHYPDIPNNEMIVLNYTSGTTGFAKGVMITGENLTGNLNYAHKTIHLNKGNNMLSFLPLAHTYGCAFEFLFPFMEGCHITLLNKTPSPKILIKAFQEVKPVLIICVPLILEKIYRKMILPTLSSSIIKIALKIPGIKNKVYSKIKKTLSEAFGGNFSQVITGGAPLNADVEAFFLKIKFPYSVGYGMTECAPLISFSLSDNYIPHSSGKVLDNMQVRIDSENPLKIPGEIQVKGQNVMLGYYKNKEATKEIFTEDGWLKTGDLGTLDKDKNVFIRGRSKSMILTASGQNIYPEELEAKLDNLPFVAESLVVNRKGKLIALVFPDYESMDSTGVKLEEIPRIMTKNKETLNKMVASYEKIAEIQVYPTEFAKTPKKSIKRYLYE